MQFLNLKLCCCLLYMLASRLHMLGIFFLSIEIIDLFNWKINQGSFSNRRTLQPKIWTVQWIQFSWMSSDHTAEQLRKNWIWMNSLIHSIFGTVISGPIDPLQAQAQIRSCWTWAEPWIPVNSFGYSCCWVLWALARNNGRAGPGLAVLDWASGSIWYFSTCKKEHAWLTDRQVTILCFPLFFRASTNCYRHDPGEIVNGTNDYSNEILSWRSD